MRPRHYTAENVGIARGRIVVLPASMRPRHYTAENAASLAGADAAASGFNEAAALHRGKPVRRSATGGGCTWRFNEAAALHRGKPDSPTARPPTVPTLQ